MSKIRLAKYEKAVDIESANYIQSCLIQIVPVSKRVLLIPGRKSKARFELVFKAAAIPPLGFKSFYVRRNPSAARAQMSVASKIRAPALLGTGRVAIETDARGGLQGVITGKGSIGVKQGGNSIDFLW